MLTLRECFDKHGSDKGDKHGYERCYESYFRAVREEPIKLLEVGCYKGASTAAFLEYFPNATIYTIDIFERVRFQDIPVLKDERVTWVGGDSTNSEISDKIKRAWGDDIKFNFIIDDGRHTPEANVATFDNCFPFLKEGGVYFIEDVQRKLGHLKDFKPTIEVDLEIVHHDYRKSTENDSYILAIKHK